jgi:hypothetical protein
MELPDGYFVDRRIPARYQGINLFGVHDPKLGYLDIGVISISTHVLLNLLEAVIDKSGICFGLTGADQVFALLD